MADLQSLDVTLAAQGKRSDTPVKALAGVSLELALQGNDRVGQRDRRGLGMPAISEFAQVGL